MNHDAFIKVSTLIDSIGLPAPIVGEDNNEALLKVADALEKLIAIALAAAKVELVDDPGEEECEAFEALQNALTALEIEN